MKRQNENTEKLFSYGTLRYERVQISTFGRKLNGVPDTLLGYRLSKVQITDPDVIAKSGETVHSVILHTGNLKDKIPGIVFDISPQELEFADKYEVSDYKRIKVDLASGLPAWVYVAANS